MLIIYTDQKQKRNVYMGQNNLSYTYVKLPSHKLEWKVYNDNKLHMCDLRFVVKCEIIYILKDTIIY